MFVYLLHAHDGKSAAALCRCDLCGTLYEIPLDEVPKELDDAAEAIYRLNLGDDIGTIAERDIAVQRLLKKVMRGDFGEREKDGMICFCEGHRGDFLNSKTRR